MSYFILSVLTWEDMLVNKCLKFHMYFFYSITFKFFYLLGWTLEVLLSVHEKKDSTKCSYIKVQSGDIISFCTNTKNDWSCKSFFLSLHKTLVSGMSHGKQSFGVMFVHNTIAVLHQKNNKSSNFYPQVARRKNIWFNTFSD